MNIIIHKQVSLPEDFINVNINILDKQIKDTIKCYIDEDNERDFKEIVQISAKEFIYIIANESINYPYTRFTIEL